MKLLLQNNPVYIKVNNKSIPIAGFDVPDWMNYIDELTLASRKVRRNGKSRFIQGLIFDDIEKGTNKEWERIINENKSDEK